MKIAFVSLHAYPAANPSAPGIFGGTETRAWTFAKGMAQHTDHEIGFLVRHQSLSRPEIRDGVTFFPVSDPRAGIRDRVLKSVERINQFPKLRIRKWSFALLWQIPLLALTNPIARWNPDILRSYRLIDDFNPDVWFCFGNNANSARVIRRAGRRGQSSFLFIGSDADLSEHYKPDCRRKSEYGDRAGDCHHAIVNATGIVVQSERQMTLLQSRFGREGILIRNPIDLEQWGQPEPTHQLDSALPEKPFVLWVGRAERFHKRADLMAELVRRCPEREFVMVLNPRDETVRSEIVSRKPPNLTVLDSVPFDQMPRLFRHADLFVSTSSAAYEGFPNVFLQAVVTRTPILSLEVGQPFLERTKAGVCAEGDLDLMVDWLTDERSFGDEIDFDQAERIVEREHSVRSSMAMFDDLLNGIDRRADGKADESK